MKKEKQIKTLSVIALVISIISLTIAYALMSSKLTINGFGNIGNNKLNVYFDNLTSSKKGTATIDKYPKISKDGTYIGDFEISLYNKNDSVTFCYDVVNKSRMDVKLKNRIINGLNIDNEDELNILKSIYISSDWDGDGITTDDELLKSRKNIRININMPDYLKSSSSKNECTTISLETDEAILGSIKLKMMIENVYIQK